MKGADDYHVQKSYPTKNKAHFSMMRRATPERLSQPQVPCLSNRYPDPVVAPQVQKAIIRNDDSVFIRSLTRKLIFENNSAKKLKEKKAKRPAEQSLSDLFEKKTKAAIATPTPAPTTPTTAATPTTPPAVNNN